MNLYNNVAPGTSGGAGGAANSGVDFTANHTGNCIGVWWFQPAAGGPANVTVTLYDTQTQAALGSAVSGALTPNAWNLVAITPVALTPGKLYTAAVWQSGGTIAFTSGAQANHTFNGDLTAPRVCGRFTNGAAPAFPGTPGQDRFGVDLEFVETATCPTCPDCSFCPCSSPVTGPDQVAGFMQTVVDCAYAAIDHTGDLAINRRGVVLGDIAWDECQCGQLVIKEDRRFGSMSFPLEEVNNEDDCGEPWLVTVYTLSLARCVPGPDANGNPPDVSVLQASATQLSKDMSQIRRAVSCCLDSQFNAHALSAYQLGAQEINGPSGGCLETTLQILVGTPQNCGCT